MKSAFKSIVVSILTAEAAMLLRRKKPTIVAITGSVGKTSTKDAIYAAVKTSVRARKSEKSFNSDIGVPLTVLGLPNGWSNPLLWLRNIIDGFFTAVFAKDYPEVLILETGIDQPGDMEKLVSWMKPDIVVLTRLPEVPVHVEYFKTPADVVAEKMRLVQALKDDGKLVFNQDDAIIQSQLPDVRQEQIGFSRYLDSAFRAERDRTVYHDDRPVGVEFTVTHQGQSHKVMLKDTVGSQHVYSVCAALAVATELGIDITSAVASLSNLRTPNGRMRLVPGIKSTTLIDDTYNSSPIAAESALQALNEMQYAKRKIAVLGDMLELGKFSSQEHLRIGGVAAECADVVITVGVRARQIAEGALNHGVPESNVFQYDDVARVGRELQAMLRAGDVVLVKASQGIRAERIIEEVMADPEQAGQLLVRQDRAWKRID